MNLSFTTTGTTTIDGREYYIQKADVTRSRHFWYAWKHAKAVEQEALKLHADPPDDLLTKQITIQKENNRFYIIRLKPKDENTSYGLFTCSYRLTDSSGLLPYQPTAVAHLCAAMLSYGRACDGSSTGIGKTFVALHVCKELGRSPAIICKKAGITTWKKVCQRYGLKPQFIVNWEHAKTDGFPYTRKARHPYSGKYWFQWKLPENVLLIFDECHMGNNPDSQNYALWIAARNYPTLNLSATFADRPSRLSGLFHVLNIMTPEEFKEWLKQRGTFTNKYNQIESLSASQDMVDIHKTLFPRYGYRLSYDDPEVKKYFPDAVYQTKIVFLGEKKEAQQNKLYNEMLVKVEYYKSLGKQAEALVEDLRYRQAAELLKAEILVDYTRQYIYEGKAVCIFVNFKETLSYLSKNLKTRSLVFGEQEKYGIDRENVIDDFQTDKTNIIICMVSAGGVSISLHDVTGKRSRISLICPTYDPVLLMQVLGRTRRAGSKSVPIMQLIYAAGTVEEKVAENVQRKMRNIQALNSGDLNEPELFDIRSGE